MTEFRIKRATVSGGPFTTLATVDDLVLSYEDETAIIGNTYYYPVSALNSGCEGANAVEAEVLMPAVEVVGAPVEAVQGTGDWVSELFAAHEQNQQLRAENERLKTWILTANQLQAQNESLRQLLQVPVMQATKFVTAQSIADQRGPFAQAILINAGSK